MKTLHVNNIRFALPDTMSIKDVQALVGFLATLQTIEGYHNYETHKSMYDLSKNPEVQIEDLELTPDAHAKSEASYEAYKAKQEQKAST
jgi:hypothetical protein